MTLKKFKRTRLGKYACREFKGLFNTDADVELYKQEVKMLTRNGDYKAVCEFCMFEGGAIKADDVLDFISE